VISKKKINKKNKGLHQKLHQFSKNDRSIVESVRFPLERKEKKKDSVPE